MIFNEAQRFPSGIGFGAQGGPEYQTGIVTVNSGFESRNVDWAVARARYDVGLRVMSQADTNAIVAFFRSMKGRAYGFRFKDWSDYQVDVTTGVLTKLAPGTWQLAKQYAAGALQEIRATRKPVSGTVVYYRGGVAQLAGLAAGNYALDTTTGIITTVADASSAVTAITVGTTTQVTLAAALSGLAINGLLYLTGLTGADAALVNGLEHTITNIAGAVYTLSSNTTGKTITAAGTGQKFAQPTEVLSWSGEFDVPVRFDSDSMKLDVVDKNASGPLIEWGQIPLVEVRI